MAKLVCFGPLFFNLIHLIQFCDKRIWHSLTVEKKNQACREKIMLLSSPKARLMTFFKTRLIEFYLNSQLMTDPICQTMTRSQVAPL